jgi:hypothetical protein
MKAHLSPKEQASVSQFLEELESLKTAEQLKISNWNLRLAKGLKDESALYEKHGMIRKEFEKISLQMPDLPDGDSKNLLLWKANTLENKARVIEDSLARMYIKTHLWDRFELRLQQSCLDTITAFEAELRKMLKKEKGKSKSQPKAEKPAKA